ncbi:uncharacterized protein LOC130727565 [Lotus japonicus]|uniref:uncharacterized protein LOC130727565 n=1 Tax=Lotus japonicus TaxID=34305 RepID=UPI00258C4A5C|nr:uncharacterized protein LOC130727565 [Lotus japonicus]
MDASFSQRVEGMQITLQEDLELERQLKLLNKPPVKSIQTKFGYIVDCIDINKQPTFDHPLLKNHKLQRKPSHQKIIGKPTGLNDSPSKSAFGLEIPCPSGTVPIRRTTKDDLIRAKSLSDAPEAPDNHVAEVHLKPQGTYYGIKGTASIWNPKVENNQSSSALVWVRNGPTSVFPTNEIIAGWHVDPQRYGDFGTHFFAAWTADNYRTGCYNTLCHGFVQTDSTFYLGALISNTMDYNRNLIFDLPISISLEQGTKNWLLNVYNRNIGYFPAELFPNLSSATQVGWGGRTTSTITSNPPMGSGNFPDKNIIHSCYFKFVSFKDQNQQFQLPGKQIMEAYSDRPKCYGAQYLGFQEGVGTILQFGGPGGYCEV